jgi:hypothetical protein
VEAAGLLRFVTGAGLGLGLLSLILLGLSLAGFANRISLIALMIACGGAGLTLLLREHRTQLREPLAPFIRATLGRPVTWPWLCVAAMPALAISISGACLPAGMLWWPNDPHPYDVLAYHLQVPREWYEAGRMIPLHHNVFSFFPFNAEMHFLASMILRGGPWEGVYTAQFLCVGFAIVTVLTIYAGAPRVSPSKAADGIGGLIAAVLVAVMPWTVMLSCVTYVESMLIMFASLAVVWALRAMRETEPTRAVRAMLLAGVMAGFAAGVKLTAVPMLLLAIPLAIAIARPRLLLGCAGFLLAAVLVLSPWLVRNAIWTGGNPVFPLAMKAVGHGHFTPVQVERFERAHIPPPDQSSPAARVRRFTDEILIHWQYGYALWPLALVALVQERRNRQIWACMVMLLVMSVVWIGFTHLIGRFFILAVPVAAMMVTQIRWDRLAPLGAAIAIISAALGFFGADHLHTQFDTWALRGRAGAFGLPDPSVLIPPELTDVEQKTEQMVVMIGHSQVFPHPIPMSRIRYRTVFDVVSDDVDPSDANQVLSAWAGTSIDTLPADAVFYVDPMELSRLSRTYYKVPDLPASIHGPGDAAFVMPVRSLPPR